MEEEEGVSLSLPVLRSRCGDVRRLVSAQLSGLRLCSLDALALLPRPAALKSLLVCDNVLRSLEQEQVGLLSGLERLDAARNRLRSARALSSLSQLRFLDLSDNVSLCSSSSSSLLCLSALLRLEHLVLSGVSAPTLPLPLLGSKTLKVLALARCNLDRLPALAGLSSLSDLDVSENALSDVDAPLSGVMSLRILVASGNPLRTVPKCASVLRKLDLRRTLVTEQQKEEAQREGLELLWEKTVEKQDEEKVTKRRKKKQKKKKLAPDGEAKEGEEEEKKQEEQLKEPTPKKQKKKKTKEKKKTKKNKKQKVALVADEAAVAQLLAPKPVDSW